MTEHDEQATGREERPQFVGFFEERLKEQVDRQDETGMVARWVLADMERGCWEEVFNYDYYMMRKEKMREGMVKHLCFPHNVSTEFIFAAERTHKEYCAARDRAVREVIDWHRKWREEHGDSSETFLMF